MKYKPYEIYKNSEIKLVRKIPEQWTTRSMRSLFKFVRGRVITNEEIIDNPGKYPVYSSQTS